MEKDVKELVRTIEATNAFEQVQVDLYSGVPISQGMNTIMVVTDYVTKYVILAGLPDKTAYSVAKTFWELVVAKHGFHQISVKYFFNWGVRRFKVLHSTHKVKD